MYMIDLTGQPSLDIPLKTLDGRMLRLAIGKQGVDISTDIETDANTFAVRFDYDYRNYNFGRLILPLIGT